MSLSCLSSMVQTLWISGKHKASTGLQQHEHIFTIVAEFASPDVDFPGCEYLIFLTQIYKQPGELVS